MKELDESGKTAEYEQIFNDVEVKDNKQIDKKIK